MSRFSFSREPVAWLHLAALTLGLLVAFNVHLTELQIGAIMGFLQGLAAVASRQLVTPEKVVQRRVKAARQRKADSTG